MATSPPAKWAHVFNLSDGNMNQTKPSQQGFTLVELLVVISIILMLATFGVTKFIAGKRDAQLVASRDHLNQIYFHLKRYENKKGRMPAKRKDGTIDSGSAFLLSIFDDVFLDKTANNAKIFFCPSLSQPALSDDNLEDTVTPETIHYAGRNQEEKEFKVGRSTMKKSSSIVIACNKPYFENEMPHAGDYLAVVFLDGSSGEFSREDYGPDWSSEDPLSIGPESPVEALHGLSGSAEDDY
ncbi:MAG: prepilin-type N-terminal cleavage/methylation domain-containing protein [Planctomycetota bacterium]|jgi:prepilin-type N-terminal cleavage/methylation domain-containing protein